MWQGEHWIFHKVFNLLHLKGKNLRAFLCYLRHAGQKCLAYLCRSELKSMGLKGTKLYSIFTFTCPRCHEGHLFVSSRAYSTKMGAMHKTCSHCGERFEPEPGFYFGAAYVSYALTVALWVAYYVALVTFEWLGLFSWSFEEDALAFILGGVLLLLALLPLIYRFSRSIWINFFVKYREDAIAYNRERYGASKAS